MEAKGLIEFYDPNYLYALSEEYGIDPGFALATFLLETGWGRKSLPWLNGYNPAGITCEGSYCLYTSPEEGMEEMYKLCREMYYSLRGKVQVERKRRLRNDRSVMEVHV